MKNMYYLSLILAIIGAINWGLIGLVNFNLVSSLFGEYSNISRIVYSLVGLGGLNLLFNFLTENLKI